MKLRLLLLTILCSALSWGQTPWINEIHYDNNGADVNEGVEIAIPTGSSCTTIDVVAYNGNDGAPYLTVSDVVTNVSCLPTTSNGVTFYWVNMSGLQNGAPDGLALICDGTVIQFLSYEGSFTATNGPANGMTSVDIGVGETGSGATTNSISLQGNGMQYSDFTWASEVASTHCSVNTGQTITSSGNLITVTQAAGGTISPGTTSVPDGNNQDFRATADACYTFTNWVVDGVNAGNANPYTFTNVTASHAITAVYTQDTYTITASAGTNGTISPSGASVVNCGDDLSYTFTADSGYAVQNVLVDGVSVGAVTSYDFTNVTGNHTISVSFMVYVGPCLSSSFAGWSHAYGNWSHSESGTWAAVSTLAGGGQIQMNDVGDYLELPLLNNPASLTYDAALSSSPTSNNRIMVQYFDGSVWVDVQEDTCISTSFTTFTISFPPVVQTMSNVRVRLLRTADDRTHYIDNLNVYCGPTCTPPADPVGTITGVNPACNSTTLSYSESAVAPVEFYWQTTSLGTSTTNNASSPLVVTTSGDYYVRAFNTSTSCWSSAEIGPYSVVIGTTATITSQPVDAATVVNGGASFSVSTSGLGLSYQWQVDTGSGFVNVTDGIQYSGSNTATLTISNASLTMDGYVYQCVVTSACGTITSNSATLSVIAATGTTFNPGELVFVGYDGQVNGSGGGAADEYLIATLVDMIPGTTFSIVNSRYEAGAPANVRTNKWGGGGVFAEEAPYVAELTYNGLTIIPAGSVLRFETNGGGNWFGTVEVTIGTTITDITADFSGSTNPSFSPNISTSGSDQMFLIQGSFTFDGSADLNEANYYLSGTLLHGITNRAAWVPLTDACNGGSSGGNSRESRLPNDLTCFNVENASTSAVSAYYENDKEHGLATIRQIVLALSDVSNNWTLGTGRYTIDPTSSSSTRAGKTFLIGASNPPGQWVGNVNTNWFDCANWEGLAVPKLTTNVTISSSSVRDAQVDFTAPYSDLYSDIAVCNDITISDRKLIVEGNANNVLNVYGDLVITATGTVDMDDSNAGTADGTIHLYGDWTNNVDETAFEEGNGIIHFDGTTAQIISNVAPEGTEIFYDVVMNNDFTTSVSNNLIATGDLLVVAGKTVTVNGNDYVQVNHDLTNNGIFNVLDDGSLIQVDDAGVNTGDISYERITTGNNLDYVYWSSPVNGVATPTSGLIFSWAPVMANPNGGLGYWVYALNTTMEPGVGYIMRNVFERTFTGVARNGVITPTISRGDYEGDPYNGVNNMPITRYDDNWNLIGNPYPSSIDAIKFLTLNSNIEGAIRIWTHGTPPSSSISDPFYDDYVANYTPDDYITYNGTGTESGPAGFNGLIAGGQSFLVNMEDGPAASGTVTFNNSLRDKVQDNSQFYRTSNTASIQDSTLERHRIWLDIIDANNKSDRTLVGYVEGATYAKDRMFDAVTGVGSPVMKIYSLIDDNKMTVQGRSLPFDVRDKVQLGVYVPTTGLYSIGISAVDGLFDGSQEIYLEDKELNIIYDLKQASYSFYATAGQINERFVLRYTNQILEQEDFTNNNDLVVYANDDIIINHNNVKLKSVVVHNVLGQVLYNKEKINNNNLNISEISKSNQALIIKVVTEENQEFTRKIIF